MRLARDRRVARRESFFLQGDPATDVFVLCAGRLKATQLASAGEQVILRLVGPGEAFGALEVGAGGQYPSGAEALEASHALLWDRTAFDAIAERNPIILRNVVRILSERMRSLEQSCRELATVRAAVRVASALVRLAGQIGRPVDGGALVALGREDLAQLTGCTPFTVSRFLPIGRPTATCSRDAKPWCCSTQPASPGTSLPSRSGRRLPQSSFTRPSGATDAR